ncbi:MAG: oligopeptidase A [Gammaproteobacteria bacterium]|nr:oligopeptidase A [Gammaproteobacteria bacterium]
MTNPLLEMQGLPAFSQIKPDHIEPAIDELLALNRKTIAELLQSNPQPDWLSVIEPIEELDDRLSRAWSPVSHMNSVVNSDKLRDAYNACLPKLSEYGTEMGQNKALYKAYKYVAENDATLDEEQKKVLENAIRDFHLSGVDLPEAQKARFKEIDQQLSKLASEYSENLLDATNDWVKQITDASELSGLPESALALAKQNAKQREFDGWVLTLDFPSYYPVMTYGDNQSLREEVYRAYNTRASDQSDKPQWDNSDIMEQTLALRHEQAQLLGFGNYAERSLAKKMAKDPQQVLGFLKDLAERSRDQALKELDELKAFAKGEYAIDSLNPWDIAYYSEKLRQKKYNISQEEVKPYFPAEKVIQGMFDVVSRLYGVSFNELEGIDTWHPDVKFFEIVDDTGVRAQFYFDLYARPKKRGGAWMDDCASRLKTSEREQIPVAYMTCNFTPPVDGKPALLTHDEVETLFHEFGHGLHHMLTRIDYSAVSGINGVAWDAVELPSQIMENWCWEKAALGLVSGHYETGKAIPDELYERMMAAKNFQSAMIMVRQLEFSIFDFRIHAEYDPQHGGRIYDILNEVRKEVAVIMPPAWSRFAHGFSHIFAGGYAAGYYSYKWAEVLSADAFSMFEENGIFDAQTGKRFLNNVLEKGGSKDAMELFVAFRGREPEIDALLRHSGIAA